MSYEQIVVENIDISLKDNHNIFLHHPKVLLQTKFIKLFIQYTSGVQ